MSNRTTKYIAASALAGAVMFGGFTIAGAQDAPDATTTTEQQATTPEASPTPDAADGQAKEGCDEAKGEHRGPGGPGGPEAEAPADSGATAESSFSTT